MREIHLCRHDTMPYPYLRCSSPRSLLHKTAAPSSSGIALPRRFDIKLVWVNPWNQNNSPMRLSVYGSGAMASPVANSRYREGRPGESAGPGPLQGNAYMNSLIDVCPGRRSNDFHQQCPNTGNRPEHVVPRAWGLYRSKYFCSLFI